MISDILPFKHKICTRSAAESCYVHGVCVDDANKAEHAQLLKLNQSVLEPRVRVRDVGEGITRSSEVMKPLNSGRRPISRYILCFL